MAKFKNLVDHLRQKRLEGVVSVDEKPVENTPKVVKEKDDVKATTAKTITNTKTTTKRKGK